MHLSPRKFSQITAKLPFFLHSTRFYHVECFFYKGSIIGKRGAFLSLNVGLAAAYMVIIFYRHNPNLHDHNNGSSCQSNQSYLQIFTPPQLCDLCYTYGQHKLISHDSKQTLCGTLLAQHGSRIILLQYLVSTCYKITSNFGHLCN